MAARHRNAGYFLDAKFGRALTKAEFVGVYRAVAANEDNHVVEAELFRVQIGGEPRAAAEIEEMMWMRVEEARGAGIGAVDEGFGGAVGSRVSAGVKARDLRTDGSFYRSLRKKYSSGRGGWKVRRGRHRWLCRWR